MYKKIFVIIGMVLFVSFKITNLHADSLQIIPPQKPTLSSEEIIKKISKNIITPLKKPTKLKKVEKRLLLRK
jgi:soluble lytic murein transglycosylase